MKKMILITLLLSPQLFAGEPELIFKNSFESNTVVAGTASGVSSTGLILQLTSGAIVENLSVKSNGGFEFNSSLTIGANWMVTITTQPTNPELLNCNLTNNSGTMTANGINNLQVSCEDASLTWDQDNWNGSNWN
jgi:hypothetical protein